MSLSRLVRQQLCRLWTFSSQTVSGIGVAGPSDGGRLSSFWWVISILFVSAISRTSTRKCTSQLNFPESVTPEGHYGLLSSMKVSCFPFDIIITATQTIKNKSENEMTKAFFCLFWISF